MPRIRQKKLDGRRVLAEMERAGITKTVIARKLGISSATTVTRWLDGTAAPELATAQELAALLNVPLPLLYGGDGIDTREWLARQMDLILGPEQADLVRAFGALPPARRVILWAKITGWIENEIGATPKSRHSLVLRDDGAEAGGGASRSKKP